MIKRVLHIVSVMNYAGIETFLMNVMRNIDREKVQFDFLVTRFENGAYDNEIRALGGNIYNIPAIKKIGYFRFKKNVNEFFDKHEYDVVHCHMNTWSGFFLPIAKKHGVPIRIAHSHMAYPKQGLLESLFRNYLKSKIPEAATHLFACSKPAAEWLFGKNKQYTYINDAIDIDLFTYSSASAALKRKELGIENKTVVGHAGRFTYHKNHLYLIDTFNEYHKLNSNSVLLLIGGGRDDVKNKVTKKINALGLAESVIIIGGNPDMPDYFCAMDIFVFPSYYEGLGMVLIEAQASGLTCIVSDTVPCEAFATEQAIPVSIKLPPHVWAAKINENINNARAKTAETLSAKGFEISDTVNKLTAVYLQQ